MFSFLRHHWFQRAEPRFFERRGVSPGRKARGRFRPMLEAFEDRCLPSLFTVSNLHNGGAGSLRSAILQANATAGADTIQFTPGLSGTIGLTSGQLIITHNLTIVGPTTGVLAVSGNHISRVFATDGGPTVTISNLTITNGNAGRGASAGAGGGIESDGALTLRNVIMTDNTCGADGGGAVNSAGARLNIISSKLANNSSDEGGAVFNGIASTAFIRNTTITTNHGGGDGDGAGIYNKGTMTIVTSTIAHNIGRGSDFFGGGIRSDGALTILASTILGNLAQGSGGGILSFGPLTIVNSTIADNTALEGPGGGGGIFLSALHSSSLAIFNCTITGNVDASANAGGIRLAGGGTPFTIYNTVVAENFATGTGSPDILGTVTAGSGNFIGSGTAALVGITDGSNGNHVGTVEAPLDPMLGPLENNGGPTLTRLPRPGSPLINAGVNAFVIGATDQRGAHRIKFGIVDIGAVEFGSTVV
jgi:hypothetical protein